MDRSRRQAELRGWSCLSEAWKGDGAFRCGRGHQFEWSGAYVFYDLLRTEKCPICKLADQDRKSQTSRRDTGT